MFHVRKTPGHLLSWEYGSGYGFGLNKWLYQNGRVKTTYKIPALESRSSHVGFFLPKNSNISTLAWKPKVPVPNSPVDLLAANKL